MSTIQIPAAFPKYGSTIEHLIAWNFIRAAQAQGFEPREYDDGGDRNTGLAGSADERAVEAMEAIFAVTDCTIFFRNGELRRGMWARFIVGNGCDIVSDFTDNEFAQKAVDACETIAAGNHEAALDVVMAELVAERAKVAKLRAVLDMAAATVELSTPNGAQSNPEGWPRTTSGWIDCEAVATHCRNALVEG